MSFRSILFLSFILFFLPKSFSQDIETFTKKADAFLGSMVIENNVNYSLIKKNEQELEELVVLISQIDPEKLDPQARKSFLINSYNLLVIKGLMEYYPTTSVQKINGFFDQLKYQVGNNSWTLNEIEKEQLFGEFDDPRLHFVLNCGAVSCPPVSNFAYRTDQLEVQLDQQTKRAINDENFIYVLKGKNYLSTIFKWYQKDFETAGGVISFINQYRTAKLNPALKNIYYPYDWSINAYQENIDPTLSSFIQVYTPSKLLKKGQLEIQLFNNLYTQTAFRDEERKKIDLGERQNYFTGLINVVWGVSENRKWNVGMDINFKSVRIDDKNSSPLAVFAIRKNDNNNRSGIGSLGPVIKISPFKKVPITLKSSFLFPLIADSESDAGDRPWLDWNRFTWWNQFFYDNNIGNKWQIFLEADLLFRFAKPANAYLNDFPKRDLLDTPLSAFLSFFPTEKSTAYIMVQYAPRFGFNKVSTGEKVGEFHAIGDYAQTGLGFKYQIFEKIGLEISYTNFFTASSQGAGNTFNLGIRYIN